MPLNQGLRGEKSHCCGIWSLFMLDKVPGIVLWSPGLCSEGPTFCADILSDQARSLYMFKTGFKARKQWLSGASGLAKVPKIVLNTPQRSLYMS